MCQVNETGGASVHRGQEWGRNGAGLGGMEARMAEGIDSDS